MRHVIPLLLINWGRGRALVVRVVRRAVDGDEGRSGGRRVRG